MERGISRGREMRGDEKREGRLLRGGKGGGEENPERGKESRGDEREGEERD